MVTWISRASALLILLALPGCLVGTGFGPKGPAPESMTVAGGRVTVGGPAGYCIDPAASRPGASPAFVLLGSCAGISGQAGAPHPDSPAVLTATVSTRALDGPGVAESLGVLAAFFKSDDGRAVLARDGQPESVTVYRTRNGAEALYLRLRDTSPGALPGTRQTYWRGVFDLNGVLVTLSVIDLSDRPISEATALGLLQAFEDRTRRLTEAGAGPPVLSPVEETAQQPPANPFAGLLR
jgi:hypothetical protein